MPASIPYNRRQGPALVGVGMGQEPPVRAALYSKTVSSPEPRDYLLLIVKRGLTLFTPSTPFAMATALSASAFELTVPFRVTLPSFVSTLISKASTILSLANFILIADVVVASSVLLATFL